jgi:hypothetical protein
LRQSGENSELYEQKRLLVERLKRQIATLHEPGAGGHEGSQ